MCSRQLIEACEEENFPAGRVAEVMFRRRGLSIEMIRKLHAGLGIPAGSVVRPTVKDEAA